MSLRPRAAERKVALGAPASRQEALDVANLRATLETAAAQTADLSRRGYYNVTDHQAPLHAATAAATELHLSMLPPDGANGAQVDAWYDGVVAAAKKGAELAKKGVKMAQDNTSAPRMVSDGKMKVPQAIHDLYTRTLQYPGDDDSYRFIVNGFIPEFEMKKSYTGKKITKHAEYIDEVKALAKKYGAKLKVDITHIFESTAGDWIPGGLKGMKLYTIISQVSSPNLAEDTMIDVIFLQRDVKDNGDWKIKKIIHDGTFDA